MHHLRLNLRHLPLHLGYIDVGVGILHGTISCPLCRIFQTGRSHVACVQDEQDVSNDPARRDEEQRGRGQIQVLIQ